jgi:MinD superfamily P-loop ATPase
MSFNNDSFDDSVPTLPGLERIDTQETANERQQKGAVIRIDYDLCDETGACAMVCPEDVIAKEHSYPTVVDPRACTECWICVENCPSGAIEIN